MCMVKTHFVFCFLILALILSSCSIEVDQPGVTTPAPTSVSAPTLSSSTESAPQTNVVTTTQVPVTWGELNLTGKLIYINGISVDNVFQLQIQVLDLVTGEVTTIFDAPKYSWVYYISVSPDHTQLLMSYNPPPGDNPVDQDIYVMPLDGSRAPERLFTPPTAQDDYIEVEWSPDSKYVYVTHVNYHIPSAEGQIYPPYTIYRKALPDGEMEMIAEKAYWPRVSPDSSRIAYVSVDLFSRSNKLFVADADGSNAREVVITGPRIPEIKDAPLFTADSQSLIFSADIPTQSYQPSWLDRLMGVRVAGAHSNVPSDWWSISVDGGEMTRLTNILSRGLFGSLSPDNQYLASYSLDGIFVMKTDGTQLTHLIPNPQSVPGTVSWIP
jgi:Tol biopolymer transport system component